MPSSSTCRSTARASDMIATGSGSTVDDGTDTRTFSPTSWQRVVEARVGAERAKRIGDLESTGDKADFVHALALRIWEADFENYSRFSGPKLVFKTGDETVLNIIGGRGGICSEKVQAVKFLTDHYGLESEYVLSGPATPDPVPEERLRQLLNTLDFRFSKRFMRYWQHLALLYRFDGMEILVDATNGNVPFLFLSGPEAEGVLGYESSAQFASAWP